MRRAHRAHHLGSGTLTRPLGSSTPPAGGLDLDLPGVHGRLAATRWPGEGTPVVLLHGLASQRRFWNLVVPSLSGLPVLALDQRGHGDSDRPDDGYDPPTVAGDLAVALDALGWSRAVVVGHSWGGAVAAAFAAAHPERTLAVVCIDGGFNHPAPSEADRAAMRKRLEPPRFAVPPDELVTLLRQHTPAAWTEEMAAAVLPIFEVGDDGLARARLPFETHMQIVDGMLGFDAPSALAGLRCPAWLVTCESPDADPDWTRAKQQALDELAVRLVAPRVMRWGAAVHDVPLQWPALVAGLIRAAVADAAQTGRTDG